MKGFKVNNVNFVLLICVLILIIVCCVKKPNEGFHASPRWGTCDSSRVTKGKASDCRMKVPGYGTATYCFRRKECRNVRDQQLRDVAAAQKTKELHAEIGTGLCVSPEIPAPRGHAVIHAQRWNETGNKTDEGGGNVHKNLGGEYTPLMLTERQSDWGYATGGGDTDMKKISDWDDCFCAKRRTCMNADKLQKWLKRNNERRRCPSQQPIDGDKKCKKKNIDHKDFYTMGKASAYYEFQKDELTQTQKDLGLSSPNCNCKPDEIWFSPEMNGYQNPTRMN